MTKTDARCLSVTQPFAHLIIHGAAGVYKCVENRSKPVKYKGRLFIHASKTGGPERAAKSLAFLVATARHIKDDKLARALASVDADAMSFGAILGSVTLTDCVAYDPDEDDICDVFPDDDGSDFWADGPFCLLLDDPRPLARPVPCKGALSLWMMPAAVWAAVLAQQEA
jgi:hypothetical protein